MIQPANPQVVYVPAYDPWIVYGGPIVAWPGWYPYPGIWYAGPYLSFGVGFGIGWFGGYGWGWHNWGFDWHNRVVVYNHNRYYSNSRTFYNRNVYYSHGGDRGVTSNPRNSFANNGGHDNRGYDTRGKQNNHGNEANRGGRDNGRSPSDVYNRPGATTKPFEGNKDEVRGWGGGNQREDTRSSTFSGYDRGGQSRSYSSRGSSSFGGGGGGFHGGGGGGGGGRAGAGAVTVRLPDHAA